MFESQEKPQAEKEIDYHIACLVVDIVNATRGEWLHGMEKQMWKMGFPPEEYRQIYPKATASFDSNGKIMQWAVSSGDAYVPSSSEKLRRSWDALAGEFLPYEDLVSMWDENRGRDALDHLFQNLSLLVMRTLKADEGFQARPRRFRDRFGFNRWLGSISEHCRFEQAIKCLSQGVTLEDFLA